jgi:flagellar basal body P-ring formation protein FlgA
VLPFAHRLRHWRAAFLPLLMTVFAASAGLRTAPLPLSGSARFAIENFLLGQAAGLNGKVTITVDSPASGALPPCDAMQPFLPQGSAAWGRLSVGVRCAGERPWTRFLAAQVAVEGRYFVAARAIAAGRTLTAEDFVERAGDLTRLPKSVITDPAQLAGMVAANTIAPGVPVRKELLRGTVVVQQGRTVRLLAQGAGFVASTEGKAMANATTGGTVQVKTADGKLLGGVATGDGQVTLAR